MRSWLAFLFFLFNQHLKNLKNRVIVGIYWGYDYNDLIGRILSSSFSLQLQINFVFFLAEMLVNNTYTITFSLSYINISNNIKVHNPSLILSNNFNVNLIISIKAGKRLLDHKQKYVLELYANNIMASIILRMRVSDWLYKKETVDFDQS